MNRCPRGAAVRTSLVIAALLPFVAAREAAAQYRSRVVELKTYRAPSGRFELTVDPSNEDGTGSAEYRFKENGKTRWSSTLPFTLIEAAITERGATVGYAYPRARADRPVFNLDDPRDFLVAILDREGKVRLEDSVEQRLNALGLVVDEPNDRIIVRLASPKPDRGESWWIYRLSTAMVVGKQELGKLWKDTKPFRFVSAVKPIPGTPLTLVHTVRHVHRLAMHTFGATFVLLDLQGRLVWSLELPFDYLASDRQTGNKLSELLREGRLILPSDQPRAFDLFFAAASQRVSYSVTQSASGEWTVKETARSGCASWCRRPSRP